MDYVRLGQSGLKVSRISLGTMTYGDPGWRDWVLDENDSRPFIARAVELGINFFDTADMYSLGRSEEVLGRALKEFTSRDQAIIATKVYNPMGAGPNDRGLSRKHIMDAVQASLKRLGTDYIDLYQIHRFDPDTPILETMTALHDLVRMGAVRYIGASSMLAYQFAKMQHVADLHGLTRFVSMQNHYNLVYREEEREMLPLCLEQGIGVIPWSPLARGRLTRPWATATHRAETDEFGKTLYAEDDASRNIVDAVIRVAEGRGVSPAHIATAWVLQLAPVTAPIIGATKLGHVEDAVKAVEITLTDEEIAALEGPYPPRAVAGFKPPSIRAS